MLLPSAFSCDSSQPPPLTRLQSALFASPPASPPQMSPQNAIGNIFSTCRNLQALLSAPAAAGGPAAISAAPIKPPSTSHAPLPTPPMAHAPSPPMKLRLRSRRTAAADHSSSSSSSSSSINNNNNNTAGIAEAAPIIARKKVVKRAPPRGANKRRRAVDDDLGRDDDVDSDLEIEPGAAAHQYHHHDYDSAAVAGAAEETTEPAAPQTPKRARIAPEALPLGLERSDYHALHADGIPDASRAPGTEVEVEADGEAWSTEEDRILVELVLDKLKLTKTEWQDCARSLGKDRHSLGRRWKSLMLHGDVGLKNTRAGRRGKIHGTWR